MEIVLGLWGVLAAAFGVMVLSGSKSAIHEILAGMGFLVATISIGSAGIIYAVNSLKKKIQETQPATGATTQAATTAAPVQEW